MSRKKRTHTKTTTSPSAVKLAKSPDTSQKVVAAKEEVAQGFKDKLVRYSSTIVPGFLRGLVRLMTFGAWFVTCYAVASYLIMNFIPYIGSVAWQASGASLSDAPMAMVVGSWFLPMLFLVGVLLVGYRWLLVKSYAMFDKVYQFMTRAL